MRKLYLFVSCIILTVFSSCNEWLTVEPQATATQDKMYSSAMGFESALTGLYQSLVNLYTPTGFLMGGYIEDLAGNYPITNNTGIEYKLSIHNFSDSEVDSNLGSTFMTFYKIIANANVLLDALESQQGVLEPEEADCIKGEALAIRAFCHSELLRLWGPSPQNVNNNIAYLPYVTTFTTEKYQYLTYQDYVTRMMNDFSQADELLKKVDPIQTYSNSILNQGYGMTDNNEPFWYYRQKRFNVYGVEALMARMYLWLGDKEKACQYAREVIAAKNTDGSEKFTLGSSADISSQDYLFYHEHLAALDIHEFYDRMGQFSGRFASLVMTDQVFNNKIFTDNTDIRRGLFMQSTSFNMGQTVQGTRKYLRMMETDYGYPHSIPLIRLSEMYLILMEAAPLDEANTYYQTYTSARSIPYVPLTESDRQQIVLKEYVKEFWSEEQIFFAYKRLNVTNSLVLGTSLNGAYSIPLPSGETGKLI